MSDITTIWKRYLAESNLEQSKRLYLFDFDDTIATTGGKIVVKSTGEELTTADYEHYKIANPETTDADFDFAQTDGFVTAEANEDILHKIKHAISSRFPVAILTGRMEPGPVRNYMYQEHGIILPVVAVSHPKYNHLGADDAEKKANWIKSQINHGFSEIYYYENSDRYISAVQNMANQPEVASKATVNIEKVEFLTQGELKLQEKEQNFQKNVKKRHKTMKIRLLGRGKGAKKPPYNKNPSYKRAKSAPPGAGGT
tara:strand:+ start:4302 stop:5069 length:768 start_codon:yes stop_codon:yes gene_type:complete